MKLTIETIRQLIKEELQHMSEASPAAVKHKYQEKFINVKGWDKDSPQFYQVYNKGTQPQNPIIGGLIKHRGRFYVDSNGKFFIYEKR